MYVYLITVSNGWFALKHVILLEWRLFLVQNLSKRFWDFLLLKCGPKPLRLNKGILESRLSIPFRSARNDRNIPYQFKKQNKTEQISSHFKSRSVPDFSAKFRPERSGSIPHVPFRS
jgi:hypothetical protein